MLKSIKLKITLKQKVEGFWSDWAVMAVLKISAVLLKYPTFGDGFFMGITSKKFEFPYIVASTLKKLKLKLP